MNFSALTKAILEDKHSSRTQSPPRSNREVTSATRQEREGIARSLSRAGTPSRGILRISRKSPPPEDQGRISPPRVVHLSASKSTSALKRPSSAEGSVVEPVKRDPMHNLVTPAPGPRVRPRPQSRANSGTSFSSFHTQPLSATQSSHESANRQQASSSSGQALSEKAPVSDNENQPSEATKAGAENGANSVRIKRPLMGGTLRRAPVRRGAPRRQSEEQPSPLEDEFRASLAHDGLVSSFARSPRAETMRPSEAHVEVYDFAHDRNKSLSQADQEHHDYHRNGQEQRPTSTQRQSRPVSPIHHRKQDSIGSAQEKPVFRMAPPPAIPSMHDQENEPPPTFKRNKPMVSSMLGQVDKPPVRLITKDAIVLQNVSPKRPALAQISQNTPLRAAPPPPKMSVLETATATAGASTVKSKKKRSHVVVNGKMFTLRGRLGKGGSSDVYRVMAENDKMFALKKVNLEDCNEDTVRGYKGEIELLKKLEDVDRVVRLFDWEVNEAKQSLSVVSSLESNFFTIADSFLKLMEIGESDLNRILSTRLHPEGARLDLAFTRHYWREMLCCVDAVHQHDIVHSDLKPANFLLIQGRLKLIDFGIANAIDIDNTVNVHRETNVGTPNYMSPESLQDTNTAERASGAPKLMKLGKPSDIWSLGCILYQMTYGKPPFAHIPNQWNRVMAIIDPSKTISYPTLGIGDVPVPASLRRLLQRCLNRDSTKRPSMLDLLADDEPFLNPDADAERGHGWAQEGAVPVTEDLLGQILQKVVERCRKAGGATAMPGDAEVRSYAKGYTERIRANLDRV